MLLTPSLICSALIFDRTLTNHNVEVDFVRTESELFERIDSGQNSYQSLFVSSDQPGFSAIRAVIAMRMRFPLSPIFLIGEGERPVSPWEMKRLGISSFVTRGDLENKLQGKMKRYRQVLPALSTAIHLRETRVEKGASIPEPFQFKGFLPVLIKDLLNEDLSLFDVHMLLSTQKMIRIFASNDFFDLPRTLTYIASGVHWVYVKESSLQQCIHYCRLFSETLLENRAVSLEMKFLHLMSDAESLVNKPPESAHAALDLSRSFCTLVGDEINRDALIALFFKHADLLNHSIAVTIISLLIALHLDISTPHLSDLIGVAALFHDVGLIELPDHVQQEPFESHSSIDRELYETHGEKGARALEIAGIRDASVLQAVSQHHERWDKSGFPNRQGAGQIHLFSEVIGISDQLILFLQQKEHGKIFDPLQRFRKENLNRFSLPVIDAFDQVFGKN